MKSFDGPIVWMPPFLGLPTSKVQWVLSWEKVFAGYWILFDGWRTLLVADTEKYKTQKKLLGLGFMKISAYILNRI